MLEESVTNLFTRLYFSYRAPLAFITVAWLYLVPLSKRYIFQIAFPSREEKEWKADTFLKMKWNKILEIGIQRAYIRRPELVW